MLKCSIPPSQSSLPQQQIPGTRLVRNDNITDGENTSVRGTLRGRPRGRFGMSGTVLGLFPAIASSAFLEGLIFRFDLVSETDMYRIRRTPDGGNAGCRKEGFLYMSRGILSTGRGYNALLFTPRQDSVCASSTISVTPLPQVDLNTNSNCTGKDIRYEQTFHNDMLSASNGFLGTSARSLFSDVGGRSGTFSLFYFANLFQSTPIHVARGSVDELAAKLDVQEEIDNRQRTLIGIGNRGGDVGGKDGLGRSQTFET